MALVQFPGTDMHDLNLDWLLNQMKTIKAQWAKVQEDWSDMQDDNAELVEFVTNYFDNLDLSAEVSAKINQMVEDGTLLNLITYDEGEGSALSDVAGQWLSAHITQETGYVIDDTLTVQGAAADAKATGDAISDLKDALDAVVEYPAPTDLTEDFSAQTGVTVTYNDSDNSITITTTNNSTWRLATNTNIISQLEVGKTYILSAECEVISGTPQKVLGVRGVQGNQYSMYRSIVFGDSTSGSVEFVATEYNNAICAYVTGESGATGTSIKYKNIKIQEKDILPESAVDTIARNAITSINNELDNIVEPAVEATTTDKTEDVELEFVSATGYYDGSGNFSTYAGVTTATINVTPGDKYLVTSRDYYSCAMVVFFKNDDSFLSSVKPGSGTTARDNYKVTVPANAAKMMLQRVYNYRTLLKKVVGVQALPVTSVLNGKRITVIGDSITEKNIRAKTNWVDYIKDWTGAVIQNLGASGTGFIAGDSNPYSNRIASIVNPDIIGVAVSFNDMSSTIADLSTAATSFFESLITAYPAIPIICYVQSPWSSYHYGVQASDDWIDALREICWSKGVAFYDDLYKGSALKPWIADNRAVYYMNDGEGSSGEEDWVHPNSEGHKVIARGLYTKFETNIVAIGLNSRIIGE